MSNYFQFLFFISLSLLWTNITADSSFAAIVKGLLDAGTCNAITTTSTICGSASQNYSYYETFTYNDTYRIVISSGVPNHNAEYDQEKPEPYERCVRYQYMKVPLNPVTNGIFKTSQMDSIGLMTSGATLFNPLSGTNGNLSFYFFGDTLDPCYGHSDAKNQYHYHAISDCIIGATDPTQHLLIGYMLDGFPVYGYSQNTAETTLQTCWKTNLTSPSLISQFSYDSDGYIQGTCHLDKANGYTFSTGYGYVMVSDNYYVPYYLAGTKRGTICGFTP